MSKRGIFITFEGPEGSGKTTQVGELIRRLEGLGNTVIQAREPGGTLTGEAIREILQHDKAGEPICGEAEVLLFAASRSQLVQQVIAPALKRGDCIVCDRFADSSTAYQGYGRGFKIGSVDTINQFAMDGTIPDLTLLLDVDMNTAFQRVADRNQRMGGSLDRMEREDRAFHERVRNGYLELARRCPERFVRIDGTLPAENVSDLVWSHVESILI